MLSGFERVRVEGPFDVTVVAGASPGAKAEGSARALDRVNVRVDGRTLVVGPGVNGWGGYPGARDAVPQVRVTVPSLSGATLLGGGRLTIDRMTGQRVDLAVSGAGTLTIAEVRADRLQAILVGTGALTVAGRALQARFQSNGAGTIDAAAFDVGALDVTAQGSGESHYTARNTAQVFAEGQGTVAVAGTASCTVRGSAPVTCGKADR